MSELDEKKRFLKNGIALLLIQIANYVAPFLVLPYLTRVLGVEGFGIISIALSIVVVGNVILDFGFSLSAPYFIARNRDDNEKVSQYLSAALIVKLMLYLLVVLGLFTYSKFIDINLENSSGLYILIGLNVFFTGILPTWLFQGLERMASVTVYVVLAKVMYIILVFIFVKESTDIALVLLFLLISNIIATLMAYLIIYKIGYRLKMVNFNSIKSLITSNLHFFISRLAVSSYTSASVLLIGTFTGVQAAAIFSCAEKLYMAAQNVSSPVSQILFPHLARTKKVKYLYQSVSILIIPMIICCYIFAVNSDFIIKTIFGSAFAAASEVLVIFLICIPITFISMNFGYPAFAIIERLDLVNKSVYLGSLFHVVNLSIMIWMDALNANNVAYSILFIELIIMLFRLGLFFSIHNNVQYSDGNN